MPEKRVNFEPQKKISSTISITNRNVMSTACKLLPLIIIRNEIRGENNGRDALAQTQMARKG